jgi:hypothetical protein
MESIDNAFGASHSNVRAKVLHFAKHFYFGIVIQNWKKHWNFCYGVEP